MVYVVGIVPPSLNSECPADIVTLGNNAAASVEWTRPIFEDAESVVQNYAGNYMARPSEKRRYMFDSS